MIRALRARSVPRVIKVPRVPPERMALTVRPDRKVLLELMVLTVPKVLRARSVPRVSKVPRVK